MSILQLLYLWFILSNRIISGRSRGPVLAVQSISLRYAVTKHAILKKLSVFSVQKSERSSSENVKCTKVLNASEKGDVMMRWEKRWNDGKGKGEIQLNYFSFPVQMYFASLLSHKSTKKLKHVYIILRMYTCRSHKIIKCNFCLFCVSIYLQTSLVGIDCLVKSIDTSQLTSDFEGTFHYDHNQWIESRIVSKFTHTHTHTQHLSL